MKILKPLLLLLAVSFLLCSGMKCKKDRTEPEPQLPAETQTGANTFGCLVDNRIWLPNALFPNPSISTVIQFDLLNFNIRNKNEAITISISNFTQIGDYILTSNSNVQYSIDGTKYSCIDGKVKILKYDKVNKILAGLIDFTCKNLQSNKTITISAGRFDVKYTD